MPRPMPSSPAWERLFAVGRPARVDRKAGVLRGYVVAQAGPTKTPGRGEFDRAALDVLVRLGNAEPKGVKSRFTHPDMSSDGLGKFLGRARDFTIGEATDARTGRQVEAVRADLYFDPSAYKTPSGDLAGYVMSLADSDPDALSSSVVMRTKREYRLNDDGTTKKDADGNELPPLFRPYELHASDIVDTGDAVDGILSADRFDADGLPLSLLWHAAELLDETFAGQSRDVVEGRVRAWLGRYLARRYGDAGGGDAAARLADLRRRTLAKRYPRLDAAAAGRS